MTIEHFSDLLTQDFTFHAMNVFIHFIRMVNAEGLDEKLLVIFRIGFHVFIARLLPSWAFGRVVGVHIFNKVYSTCFVMSVSSSHSSSRKVARVFRFYSSSLSSWYFLSALEQSLYQSWVVNTRSLRDSASLKL